MEEKLLHHEIESATASWPEKKSLIAPSGALSFQDLNGRASAIAGALQALGFSHGDRLAILAQNSPDYIVWHYAAARIGVIFHVLNTRLVYGELQWMIDNAESKGLIAGPGFQELAANLKSGCPSLQHMIGMDGEAGFEHETEEFVSRDLAYRTVPIDPGDPALMIYTSGTTGRPKGALQSHGGSLTADRLTRDAVGITGQDRYLALMPFFHQAGLIRTRATLMAGGQVFVPGKVSAKEAAEALTKNKITFTMIASGAQSAAIREKLLQDGPEAFASFRMLLGGGGQGERAAQTIEKMCSAIGCDYFGVYGQTETTGPAVYITGADVFERPASCGKPLPGVAIEIWDEQQKPLAAGQTGEIVVKGPITARYWRNEEANEALYHGDWVRTGDLGYLDEDGFLFFKGRVKELIKTGAENVYPREVEAVLEAHPDIADVAIIGVPDATWGEMVVAALVGYEGRSVSLEEVDSFCRGKIGGYKIPKLVHMVEEVPRNHTGKILRGPLVELVQKERGGRK